MSEPRPLNSRQTESVLDAQARWDYEQNEIAAAEFVGVCLMSGELEAAEDAAAFLAEAGSNDFLRQLGQRATDYSPTAGMAQTPDRPASVALREFLYQAVALQKQRTRADPRSAISWADLARRYTALGQFDQAERALKVALELAPTSRYIRRSAARFYVHIGRPDRGHAVLAATPRTQDDPWLMASLLSVASVGDIPIESLKPARRILERGQFRQIEMAELVSELATLDLRGGKDRRALRLFNESLSTPTDNSLAQVEWASHRMTQLAVPLNELDVPFAAEAHALSAADDGNWTEALKQAERWLYDQPFDTDAAAFGSYVAAVGLEQWSRSEEIAEVGLRARPGVPVLINNLSYSLIEQGRLEEAARLLSRARISGTDPGDRIALTATVGLLHLRLGNFLRGRELYHLAIERARRSKDRSLELMASTMFLREVLRQKLPDEDVGALLTSVEHLARVVQDRGVLSCVDRTVATVPFRSRSSSV